MHSLGRKIIKNRIEAKMGDKGKRDKGKHKEQKKGKQTLKNKQEQKKD